MSLRRIGAALGLAIAMVPAMTSVGYAASQTLSINDVSVTEGDAGTVNATFTVTVTRPPGKRITVGYATSAVTAQAGSDFTATAGTLVFGGKDTVKTITVPVLGDNVIEADETFQVLLSNATRGVTILDGTGVGTIVDDGDGADLVATTTITANSPTAYRVTGALRNDGPDGVTDTWFRLTVTSDTAPNSVSATAPSGTFTNGGADGPCTAYQGGTQLVLECSYSRYVPANCDPNVPACQLVHYGDLALGVGQYIQFDVDLVFASPPFLTATSEGTDAVIVDPVSGNNIDTDSYLGS